MARTMKKFSPALALDSADNTSARLEQQRRLAAIKPIGVRDIPIKTIKIDRTFNVREDVSYTKEANLDLYNSLREFGVDQTKPLMAFSENLEGQNHSNFFTESGEMGGLAEKFNLVLRGNIRATMIFLINEEEISSGKPPRFSSIPGLLYRGLSKGEEILIMADHTGSKELNRYELAGMIGRAREARGLTYEQAASYFGINQNTVQRLSNTWEMSIVYENLHKIVHEDDDAIPIGQTETTLLWKGYKADFAANGVFRDCSGPAFAASWETMLEKIEKKQSGEPVRKGKTGKEIDESRSSVGAVGGMAGEFASVILGWTLGEPIGLGQKVREFKDKLDAILKRYDLALERITELEQENAQLKQALADLTGQSKLALTDQSVIDCMVETS